MCEGLAEIPPYSNRYGGKYKQLTRKGVLCSNKQRVECVKFLSMEKSMIVACSLDMFPLDRREDVVRDLSLEPQRGGMYEGGLTVFRPKEAKKKKKSEPKLVLADSTAGHIVWQNLTPTQRLVAQGILVEGKGYNELAESLSDEFTRVHPDDVELAHRCACDVARSVAVAC